MRQDVEALATVHLSRWEHEADQNGDPIPHLDFASGSDGVIINLCRRIGTTTTESLLAGFSFVAGMHFGRELGADPFDGYPKLRAIVEEYAKMVQDVKVNADRDAAEIERRELAG